MLFLCGSQSEGAGVFEDYLEIMRSADLQWTMQLIIFRLCLNTTFFFLMKQGCFSPPKFNHENPLAVLLSREEMAVPHDWRLTVV